MIFKLLSVAVISTLFGAAVGMSISDSATIEGYPYSVQMVRLNLESSEYSEFYCSKLGAILGDNLSTYDFATKKRLNCILRVTGKFNPNGSFTAYPERVTWAGRFFNGDVSITIPKHLIQATTSSAFDETGSR